jgi:hypothetical protein
VRIARVDTWTPFRQYIKLWLSACRVVCVKFQITKRAGATVGEVCRAELFRKRHPARELVKDPAAREII